MNFRVLLVQKPIMQINELKKGPTNYRFIQYIRLF